MNGTMWFSFVGTLGWFWVGIADAKENDRALIMLNATLSTLLFMGLLKLYFV